MILQEFKTNFGRKCYINPIAITCLIESSDNETAIYFHGDDHVKVEHSLQEVVDILGRLKIEQ